MGIIEFEIFIGEIAGACHKQGALIMLSQKISFKTLGDLNFLLAGNCSTDTPCLGILLLMI